MESCWVYLRSGAGVLGLWVLCGFGCATRWGSMWWHFALVLGAAGVRGWVPFRMWVDESL